MNALLNEILAHEHSADLLRAADRVRLADELRRGERAGKRSQRRGKSGRLSRLNARLAPGRP